MFLLDTNIISELRRTRPHGAVTAWLGQARSAEIFISAAAIGEIQVGIERVRGHDSAKADEIENWLAGVVMTMNIIAADAETFRIWAKFMHGKPPVISSDAMMAATAVQHDLTVATRNTRDFRQFPVRLLNPFDQI